MKKTFAICLLIALLGNAMLSGCGDAGVSSDTSLVENVSAADETDAPSAETGIAPVEAVDMNGDTMTILVSGLNGTDFLFDEFYAEGTTGDVVNDAIFQRNSVMQEKYNMVIETVDASQNGIVFDVQKVVQAGEDVYDMIAAALSHAMTCGIRGYLMDLRTVPHLQFDEKWWHTSILEDISVNNKNFCMIGAANLRAYESLPVLYFNKKILKEADLEMPYEYVLDGTWTLDTLKTYCQKVSEDVNGDGRMNHNDKYGLGLNSYGALTFSYGSGVQFVLKDNNDIPYLELNDERFTTFFQDFIEMVSDKQTIMLGERMPDRIETINKAFKEDRLLFLNEILNRTTLFRDMDTDYGIVPMPKQDEAQEKYHAFPSEGSSSTCAIPVTCSDPDTVGRLVEDLNRFSY